MTVKTDSKVATPPKDSSEKYRLTYETLFAMLSQPLQKRVLEVKANPSIRDVEVEAFIREVVTIAESDAPLPLKDNKK